MDHNIFQSCSDLDHIKILPAEEFKRLDIIDELGRGEYSIVFRLILDSAIFALRLTGVQRTTSSIKEIRIGCLINTLTDYTHSLQHLKYFAFFENLNNIRSDLIEDHEGKYLATISNIIEYPNINYIRSLSDNDKIDILFEILMAVYLLNSNKIAHGDLHGENIGFIKQKSKRSYIVDGIEFLVECQYMPIIFDYGEAYILKDERSHEAYDRLEGNEELLDMLTNDERDMILTARNVKDFSKIFKSSVFKHITNRKIESNGNQVIFFKSVYTVEL